MPLRLTRNSVVGLTCLAAIGAVLAWSLLGKPAPADVRVVRVELRDVRTLGRFDRDVRVAGVNVGTVGKVVRRQGRAVVELRLDPDRVGTVHADASAELRPHTLFDGSAFIELRPGSPSAPELGDQAIPLQRTAQPVSLDEALRLFSVGLRRDLPALAHDVRVTLRPVTVRDLRQTGERATGLFRAATPALRAAQGPTRSELAGAVQGSARVVTALARAEDDLAAALGAAAPTIRAVRAGDEPVDAAVAALPSALRSTTRGARALRGTVRALRPLARELTPALARLAPVLREVRPVAREATPVLTAARPFLRDVRSLLRLAAGDAPSATRLIERLRPVVTKLDADLVPFLNSHTATGVPVYRGLAGTVSGAAGILAPTPRRAGDPSGKGMGHGWHMTPSLLAPVGFGCASIPDETLRKRFQELELCVG